MASAQKGGLKLNGKLDTWRAAMGRMTLKDLLKIKFCYDESKKWLIVYSPYGTDKKSFYCTICKMVLIDGNAVKSHNGLNKHNTSLESKVYDLCLEAFDPFKTEKKEKKSEEKLEYNDVDFKNIILSLNLEEILEIEYKMNGSWRKLLVSVKNGYTCTICKSNLLTNIHGIRNHMSNRQHKCNIELIKELHHPSIFPMKDIASKQRDEVKKVKTEESLGKESSVIKDVDQNKNLNTKKMGPIQISFKSTDKKENCDRNKDIEAPNEKLPNNQKITKSPEVELEHQFKKKSIIEFLHEMGSMRKQDILEIEYKGNDTRKWNHVIVKDGPFFTCDICNVKKLKDIPLSDHIKGKKHKDRARMVVCKFFHPLFTEPKESNNDENKAKEGNLNTLGVEEISVAKNSPKGIESNKNLIQATLSKTLKDNENLSTDIEIINSSTDIVTVEDSPDRDLNPPGTDLAIKKLVLNPMAVAANKTIDSSSNLADKSKIEVVINKKKKEVESVEKKTIENAEKINTNAEKIKTNADKINANTEKINTNSGKINAIKPSFQKKNYILKMNGEVEGFVGIEFVIKIIKHVTDNDPRFECCLCETELNGTDMQYHLKGLAHRTKYLERHFPTCMKQYKEFHGIPGAMYQITEKICKAVEKYHGRDLPLECVRNDYSLNRRDYMEKVFTFRHASEICGPSFTNIVDKKELQRIVKDKDFKIPDKNENDVTFTMRDNQRKTNYPFTTESDHPSSRQISKISVPKEQRTTRMASNYSNALQHHQQADYDTLFDSVVLNNIPFEPIRQNYEQTYNTGFYPETQIRPNIQYESSNDKCLDNEEHRRLAEKFIKNTKMTERYHRQRSHSPRRHRRSRSRSRSKRDMRSPSKSPLRENDVWQAYRRKFDIDVKIIKMDFEQYYKDPQSHPMYNEEWQTFWASRMNELKKSGRDHHNHNFTYEWSVFFPKRLEELYDKEVESLKIRLRERFVLPMHNHELHDTKYHIKTNLESNIPNPPNIFSSNNNNNNNNVQNRGHSPTTTVKRNETNSPIRKTTRYISDESFNSSKRKSVIPENNLRDDENMDSDKMNLIETSMKKRKKFQKSPSPDSDDLEKKLENDSLTAMSVIRVLTALEDNLGGSLGPKIIDLMSKALVLEKTKPNAVDENLLTTDNCILLETCREKLKGQIVAGLYKNQQLPAIKNVIRDITNLVKKASEVRAKNSEKQIEVQNILKKVSVASAAPKFSSAPRPGAKSTPKAVVPVSNFRSSNQNTSGYGANAKTSLSTSTNAGSKQSNTQSMSMNQKKELAKKLAQALAAQGKTDISTENCEQLIEVYTLIDKKQLESGELTSQEKSLSECLQDCIKSGSLTSLTSLIQDKNRSSEQTSQQSQQFNQMSSQMQSLLMSLNQNTPAQQNDYRNFSNLANFDTSLNFNTSPYPNTSSYRGMNNSGSNRVMYNNNNPQNWVQGSVLSGSNYSNMPSQASSNISSNGASYLGASNLFHSNNDNHNQVGNNDFNTNNTMNPNWQRYDINSSLQQQNNQNQYGGADPRYNAQGRYNRR